jgi:class 3 adenylate cyclase
MSRHGDRKTTAAIDRVAEPLREGHVLLESQVQAINRFPDQNPHPVMRLSDDGHLTYANISSEPVRRELGVEVGEPVPGEFLDRLRVAVANPGERVELSCGHRTFALLPVAVPDLGFMNVYGTDITAEKVVERFPNQNPNPVFRVDDDGRLIYANAASQPLIEAFGMKVGDLWPHEIAQKLLAAADLPTSDLIEIEAAFQTYALRPVRIAEFGFINVYGTNITAEKVVAKFPGQNPHPVLRMTREGALIYANAASQPIVGGLHLEMGKPLPHVLRRDLLTSLERGVREPVEIRSGEQDFELLPVLIPEFAFVNIYGTDVTAAREVARAKEETERLLLNILPPPIADRLRHGEQVIADRFEDSTLLIADIVGFTALSSQMSADDIVVLLNDIFSAIDVLVERHGLEKVKTIGDAYMVIGGVPMASPDHVERVADFALDMVMAIEGMQARMPHPISCRIGINCGPVVAGVIGTKRTIYDVWGDTVNMASRMESLGVPGRIHVTPAVYERLRDGYSFEERGAIEVKGKGTMPTYFLTGRSS